MVEYEQNLLKQYLQNHHSKVNKHLMQIIVIYLMLSSMWNGIFLLFDLPYSRANLVFLLFCLGLLVLLGIIGQKLKIPPSVMRFLILLYCNILIVFLYFGSGYTESWSFFLLIPLLAGIYGERRVLVIYSFVGLLLMTVLSIYYPKSTYIVDSIDISNRILIYIILATFSFLLIHTLHQIYSKQVETVIQSSEKIIEEVAKSFIISVEAKDTYTFGHSERVSQYAVVLAMELPEYQEKEALRRLKLSGLLHDIGKINIPESILTKSEKLTDEEFDVIKTHTIVGAKMIERMENLQELKNGVLYHHERWDGTGYPTKIKGNNIPLDARILSIADAFDAMTSNRSYRQEISVEEAFNRLEAGKGTQFDPYLIELIQQVKHKYKEIHNNYNNEIKEFETLTDLI